MSDEQQPTYKVTIAGPGHSFERDIDEVVATKLITLAVTGKLDAGAPQNGAATVDGGLGDTGTQVAPIRSSLASHIKAKKADKNQVSRFLATAQWLQSRGEALSATSIAKALSENNQKRLANPADCLNKNVGKGFCEKRKDGTFFITPEGLEALDRAAAE